MRRVEKRGLQSAEGRRAAAFLASAAFVIHRHGWVTWVTYVRIRKTA